MTRTRQPRFGQPNRASSVSVASERRWRRSAVTIGAVALVLWPASSAVATASPESTAPSTTVTESLSNNQSFDAAIWALVFGLVAVIAVLVFLWQDRRRSFRALGELRRYCSTTSTSEPAIDPTAIRAGADGEFQLVGPDQLTVGTPTGFIVINVPTTVTPADLRWSVVGEATLSGDTGDRTRLTATSAGSIRVEVSTADGGHHDAVMTTAQANSTGTTAVPFLGRGYGSVVIGLSVAAVTAALGLTKVIDGQAVAGILGSLVTYTVARGGEIQNSGGQATGEP